MDPAYDPAAWTDFAVAVGVVAATLLAAVDLLTDSLGGLYWLPVLVIAAIVGSLAQAWVLLIEILR